MVRTYTRRGLRCPTCGAPLKVRLTGYRNGSVIRYRYCKSCDATFKTVERFMEDFSSSRTAAKIARAIGRFFCKPQEGE